MMRKLGDVWAAVRIDRLVVTAFVVVILLSTSADATKDEDRQGGRSMPPTSETIAFVSGNGIWLVEADGSHLRRLTTRWADRRWADRSPVWSPDGSVVAFVRTPEKGSGQLRTINATGSGGRVLVEDWQGDEPTWSPDGRSFAYYCGCDGSVHVMDVAGSQDATITRSHATRSPAWSPDGLKIAYSAPVARRFRIFTVNPDGTNPTRLTRGPGSDQWPDWSSDGTRIVFSRWRRGAGWDLYVVDISASTVVRLTRTTRLNEIDPSWSADDTRIAFDGFRPGARRSFLYVLSADGSERVKVTDKRARQPVWRPTGDDPASTGVGSLVPPTTVRPSRVPMKPLRTV